MKTGETHSKEDLLLAIALRDRAVAMRTANEFSDSPLPDKPIEDWLVDAIKEAKNIADFTSVRL
jgi:hypothetical protein